MEKVKAGIIGAGNVGKVHVEALRRLGNVEILGVSGSSQRSAEERARQLGIPRVYQNYQEMLADPDIQVVHNCTPNQLHYQINRDALLAGKHVLCEKPLTVEPEQARELVELAEQRNLVHGVMFNYRMYPMVQEARSAILGGDIGQINLVHGSYLQDWLLYDTDYNWRLESELGGLSGALADIGSHWCDLAEFMTGSRIVSVFVDMDTVVPERTDLQGRRHRVRVEDYATVLLRFANGARGVFTVSQVSPGHKNRLRIEVDGARAALAWDQEQPEQLWFGYRSEANRILLKEPANLRVGSSYAHYPAGHIEGWPDGLKNLLAEFYQAVRQEKLPSNNSPGFPTFKDGYRSVAIISAMLDSYRTGQWVKIIVE
ncbi:Gfo/Idh/MocA family protein [Desulfotomaculum nigrificans]|uniref:Gfo/Idh/MocA family protein n=1 Tax=Desulfotomaculum nigrificans TaxID=1565 RepID=UPI0001FAEC97|nr:Gfo/Idh/MocA family oxidoreductase [Desulfotomaculum nigrificans]